MAVWYLRVAVLHIHIDLGLWSHTEKGFFGGGQEYAYPPFAFAPNPVGCLWTGPYVSNITCSSCVIGYARAGNGTCVKPAFGPRQGWKNSAETTEHSFQHIRGLAIKPGVGTSALTLRAGHTYVQVETVFYVQGFRTFLLGGRISEHSLVCFKYTCMHCAKVHIIVCNMAAKL